MEIAHLYGGMVAVRDSKNPTGPALTFTPGERDAFLAGAKEVPNSRYTACGWPHRWQRVNFAPDAARALCGRDYDWTMSLPRIERPDLPEYMTWEVLEQLPEEIAGQIELWNGRVVWLRRGPAEYQAFTFAVTSALKRCARTAMAKQPESCWRVDFETNVFFGEAGKSDFVTPDFLAYRCLDAPYQDIRAKDVLLVGEVLSPSNTPTDMDDKQARYAKASIPWYWEVTLEREKSAIAMVRAFALETTHGKLPPGVHPLHPANYLLTGKWAPKDSDAIDIEFPFPIHIPWSDLEF